MKKYPFNPYTYPTPRQPPKRLSGTPRKVTFGPSLSSMGSTLSGKRSTYRPITGNNFNKRDTSRLCTKSIEQLPVYGSEQNAEEEELFERSSLRIGQLKRDIRNSSIDRELNEVLQMIREEKVKIGHKITALRKSNDYYKELCKADRIIKTDRAVNTEALLQCQISQDAETQTGPPVGNQTEREPRSANKESLEQPAQFPPVAPNPIYPHVEVYNKLASMLQEMKVDPRDVLPREVNFQVHDINFKQLTDAQVIKIQKFFIKKLVQKVHK